LLAQIYVWFIGFDQAYWISIIAGLVLARTSGKPPGTLTTVLGALALAVISLVKFNFTIVSAWAVLILGAYDLASKKLPWVAIAYTIFLPVAWIACGQQLANFPEWLWLSLNLSAGYSDAMARPFWADYSLTAIVLLYAAVALPCVVLLFLTWPPRARELALFAFFGGVGFVSLKHALGGNQIEQAAIVQILVAYCVALVAMSAPERAFKVRLPIGITTAASVGVLALTHFSWANLAYRLVRLEAGGCLRSN
jgi:hypothetical protein